MINLFLVRTINHPITIKDLDMDYKHFSFIIRHQMEKEYFL